MGLLLKLIGVNFKTTFGLSALRDKYLRRREKLWQPILAIIGILAGFGTFVALILQMAFSLVQVGNAFGQPEIVFTLAILGTELLLLFMGLFLVISSFYFSADLSLLVPLPIQPAYILISKLAVVVANEFLTSLFLFVPAVIAYVRLIGISVTQALHLLLVFLLTPVLPLAISSLVALALMRLINRRHRDTLMVVTSLFFVVLSLGINFSLQAAIGQRGNPEVIMRQIISTRYGLIQSIGNRFPPAVWATKAIAQAGSVEGTLHMLGFAAITLFGLALVFTISGKLFYAGLIGGDEIARRRRSLSTSELTSSTEQKSILTALFWREWKLFMRTPIFALNGFLGALIMPIAMLLPLTAQGHLTELILELQSGRSAFIGALCVAALIMVTGSVNTIASTSISREGKFFYISKMIPVTAELQARAKMFHAIIGAVISAVPLTVTYVAMVRPSLFNLVAAVSIGLAGSLMGMALGLYVDMRFPRLKWTNPQQAVKQNLNAVVPMFLMMAVIGLAALLTRRLLATTLSYSLIYLLFLLLMVIPGVAFYLFTVRAANRLYHRLDI